MTHFNLFMSDNRNLELLVATEYKVSPPEIKIPLNIPNWVQNFYPQLMITIYNEFDSVMEKMLGGFNDCLVDIYAEANYRSVQGIGKI